MIRALGILAGAIAAGIVHLAVPAAAEPAGYVPQGAAWTQERIDVGDGTVLAADVLRPAGLRPNDKTPVIISVGPYFDHSGGGGVFGYFDGLPYDPKVPVGPSTRFDDFVTGARLMERGYTFVMVSLRGTGGSTGCFDFGGPGEQADVAAAVRWAATQPWSTGKVGMYGKSYDGFTGLQGAAQRVPGLAAVVAQTPMYTPYRYLYANRVRYTKSPVVPVFYSGIAATPGIPGGDAPDYVAGSLYDVAHPECLVRNTIDPQDENPDAPYWQARDLLTQLRGSTVPLFLTQGMLEYNARPDGLMETLDAMAGPTRAWLGMWNHVRSNQTDAEGNLLTGRPGWFDEVMRFYDEHLEGIAPAVADPAFVIQGSDGRWRGQASWPGPSVQTVTATLPRGSYVDALPAIGSGSYSGVADANTGLWSVSAPLPAAANMSGAPIVRIQATAPANANITVDLYDVAPDGNAAIVSRTTALASRAGGPLELLANDWRFEAGHRIAVRVTNGNHEWYLNIPSFAEVRIGGGAISIPFATCLGGEVPGAPSTFLPAYKDSIGHYRVDPATPADPTFPMPPAVRTSC